MEEARPTLAAIVAEAQLAERERDHSKAASLYQDAVDRLDRGSDGAAWGQLLLKLSQASFRGGHFAAARRHAWDLAGHGRRISDPSLIAAAALVMRGVGDIDVNVEVAALCREALEALGEENSDLGLRASLNAQLVMAEMHLGRPGNSANALRLAEESGDAGAISLALHARQMASAGLAHARERLQLVERSLETARATNDLTLEAWARTWEVDACLELGIRPELDRALDELERRPSTRASRCAAGGFW